MILDKIKDNPIFVSSGPKPQKPVLLQLLVATRRLGYHEDAGSIGNVAKYYGVEDSIHTTRLLSIRAILFKLL